MKKNNSFLILISLVLLLALAAAISLVQTSQETRRGAYFAGTKILMEPNSFNAGVGQDVLVPIFVETQPVYSTTAPSKVDFVQTKICYGEHIKIDVPSLSSETEIRGKILFDQQIDPAFTEVVYTRLDQPVSGTNPRGCLEFAVRSDRPRDQLKSGMVKVATVKFKAMTAGSGNITFDTTRTTASGYNVVDPGNVDQSLRIEEYGTATYIISGQTKYTRGQCNTGTGKYSCTTDPNGSYNTVAECENSEGCDVVPTSTPEATPTTRPEATPTTRPEATPTTRPEATSTPGQSANAATRFKISFIQVRPDSQCANWNIQLIAMGPGGTKVYTNVPVSRLEIIGDKVVYQGAKVLEGFTDLSNVALFVKGPKHLQMKYARDNQDRAYDRAGGELTLTTDINTTPIYNFTNYVVLAGDVVTSGPDGNIIERQDGVVDGRDFSYVKTRAIQRGSVDPGGWILADLNGDCAMNSVDISTLMLSLAEKQEQLY